MCVAAMHAYGRRSACAYQCSRAMAGEGVWVSVHGVAGQLLQCVMPHGSTLASLRRTIKVELGIPKRLQTFIIGREQVSPLEALDAVHSDCVEVTLLLRQPVCGQCGRAGVLSWCGGCFCVLYCSAACQRAARRAHTRVCARANIAGHVIKHRGK